MLSFVIPALNERENIGVCINAIKRDAITSGNAVQVIVVDNGSTDDTAQIAEAHGAMVIKEPRRGTNFARQAGLDNAQCALVAFVDADSEIVPGFINRAAAAFAADRDLVCVGARVIYTEPRWLALISFPFFSVVKTVNTVMPTMQATGFVARRDALRNAGGFDTSITFYGDDTATARALAKVGKLRIDLGLKVKSSPRRFYRQGFFSTLYHYWAIGFLGTYLSVGQNDGRCLSVGPAPR